MLKFGDSPIEDIIKLKTCIDENILAVKLITPPLQGTHTHTVRDESSKNVKFKCMLGDCAIVTEGYDPLHLYDNIDTEIRPNTDMSART